MCSALAGSDGFDRNYVADLERSPAVMTKWKQRQHSATSGFQTRALVWTPVAAATVQYYI